ncbi:uncharacterized protein LOC144425174 [Styela clava]
MSSVQAQEAVEELLECTICTNPYEASGPRTPKMLPCQHVFCLDCIKKIADGGNLVCPICRAIHNIDAIQNSFILLQLLERRKCESYGSDRTRRRMPAQKSTHPQPQVNPEISRQVPNRNHLNRLAFIDKYFTRMVIIFFVSFFIFILLSNYYSSNIPKFHEKKQIAERKYNESVTSPGVAYPTSILFNVYVMFWNIFFSIPNYFYILVLSLFDIPYKVMVALIEFVVFLGSILDVCVMLWAGFISLITNFYLFAQALFGILCNFIILLIRVVDYLYNNSTLCLFVTVIVYLIGQAFRMLT